ncbi:MAG: hypothetical protein IIC67_09280 [Thaumarchaeota archaeon]|nr:hypothetical protein [Nitrososphaerota archaeon]
MEFPQKFELPTDVYNQDSIMLSHINLFFGTNGTGKTYTLKIIENKNTSSFFVDENRLFNHSIVITSTNPVKAVSYLQNYQNLVVDEVLADINDIFQKLFPDRKLVKDSPIGSITHQLSIQKKGKNYAIGSDGRGMWNVIKPLEALSLSDENSCVLIEEFSLGLFPGFLSKYYELIHTILSSASDSFDIAQNFPEHVIRLADLFWFQIPNETDWRSGASIGVEQYFCITPENHHDYYPASALQTPIFQLLRFAPKQTIDFILTFTNKTVECYSKSNIKNEVEEVEVFIDETKSIKQYISNRLWNMYRGTQVSTYLLESIHMALEKWMLEYAKSVSKENLASWCKYLIENSKSASITAVVTSVVLAQPSGLFDIAKLLFRTKEFFLYDTSRIAIDQTAKSYFLWVMALISRIKSIRRKGLKLVMMNIDECHWSIWHLIISFLKVKKKVKMK